MKNYYFKFFQLRGYNVFCKTTRFFFHLLVLRVVKWVLLNAHSVWQSYPWNTSQNYLLVAIALAMIVSSSTFG